MFELAALVVFGAAFGAAFAGINHILSFKAQYQPGESGSEPTPSNLSSPSKKLIHTTPNSRSVTMNDEWFIAKDQERLMKERAAYYNSRGRADA